MSKKENIISPSDEVKIVNAFKYWYETNTEKGVTSIPDYICKGLLDLYQKEKEKNVKLKKDKQILYGVIDEIKEERN